MIDQEEARLRGLQRTQLRTAAVRARKLYPGPVGELVAQEIAIWDEMGFRFGGKAPMMRLVEYLMAQPVPEPAPKSPG